MVQADRDATSTARRAGRLGAMVAGALAVEYVPAVVTLGQWGSRRALPWNLCRWQGPRFPPRVALTFDDGPDPDGTPAVLEKVDALGMTATFFVLGSHVEESPELVGEILRRGHAVGVHGYEHAHHLLHGPGWVRRDLVRAKEVVRDAGAEPVWFRPPYGQATASTLLVARALALRTVLWSAWGREWATDRAHGVAGRVARRLRPGAIVLLHDSDRLGTPGMWKRAVEALEILASELACRGLTTVTLDELVR